MTQGKERTSSTLTPSAPAMWLGKSGRLYAVTRENLSNFAMRDADLYVIARGNAALWVGSTLELVGEPASRRRFRSALNRADTVFHLQGGMADADHLSTMVDLEGGTLAIADAQAA